MTNRKEDYKDDLFGPVAPSILRAIYWILRVTFAVFVTLRACDVITWGWFAVLSPVIARPIATILYVLCMSIIGIRDYNKLDPKKEKNS